MAVTMLASKDVRPVGRLPGGGAIDVPDDRPTAELGEWRVTQGGIYAYCLFGADTSRNQVVMFDDNYGGERSDNNNMGAAATGKPKNGARPVESDFGADGSSKRNLGVLPWYDIKAGQYGWVKIAGGAVVKIVRDVADDNFGSPNGTGVTGEVFALGCDEADGALSPWSAGCRIFGIFFALVDAPAAANAAAEVDAMLDLPVALHGTALAAVAQPAVPARRYDETWVRRQQNA